jgi:hypothetical protein
LWGLHYRQKSRIIVQKSRILYISKATNIDLIVCFECYLLYPLASHNTYSQVWGSFAQNYCILLLVLLLVCSITDSTDCVVDVLAHHSIPYSHELKLSIYETIPIRFSQLFLFYFYSIPLLFLLYLSKNYIK